MKFFRKLPVPKELKEQFPADERIVKIKQERDPESQADPKRNRCIP